jgi:hypothetical protein
MNGRHALGKLEAAGLRVLFITPATVRFGKKRIFAIF